MRYPDDGGLTAAGRARREKVGMYRGKRVNPVFWHMINSSCRRSYSYIAIRIDTC